MKATDAEIEYKWFAFNEGLIVFRWHLGMVRISTNGSEWYVGELAEPPTVFDAAKIVEAQYCRANSES